MAEAERMFRLAQMAGLPTQPAKACLLAENGDATSLGHLEAQLGIPVQIVRPGQFAGLTEADPPLENPARYAAAIGLALEALRSQTKATATKMDQARPFNFLTRRRRSRKKISLSWRGALLAAGVLVAIALSATAGRALVKYLEMARLQEQYDRLAPLQAQQQEAQQRLQAVRSWIAQDKGGQRTKYLPILVAITELFPSTSEAYVTSLEIRTDSQTQELMVRLDGRSRGTEVLYEFVSRLNNSQMFDKAQLGRILDQPDTSSAFVKRFSVTFGLRSRDNV